jgi:hypothetical protein
MKKSLVILSSLFFAIFSNSYCSNYLSDAPKVVNDSNLLKNGDFSDSLKNWQTIGQGTNLYHPEDPGRADFNIENGVLEVKIKNPGNGIYSIMLYQPVLLKKDTTYIISFYAKSDSDISIISNLTQDVTWTNFSGDQKFELTNVMTNYSYKFKMTQNCEVLFQFCLGGKGPANIFLDSISLKRQSEKLTNIEIQSQQKSELKIFPNPADERFILIADDQIINKVEILNISGQVVATKVTGGIQQVLFERNNIRSGTYFCKAFTKNSCLVGKLLLK